MKLHIPNLIIFISTLEARAKVNVRKNENQHIPTIKHSRDKKRDRFSFSSALILPQMQILEEEEKKLILRKMQI